MLTMFSASSRDFLFNGFRVSEPDTGLALNALCAYEGKARPVSTNGNAHEISLVEGL
jgi:hypothetical protein